MSNDEILFAYRFWSDWSKLHDMERTVTNRRGVRNGTAFRLCTDYVLLRNLGILGRWKDTVWKEGKMSAYAHRNGGKFKDYDLRDDLTE